MNLDGRIFLLTGCASGMGRHLTGALAARGAWVMATDVAFDALTVQAKVLAWPLDRVQLRRLDVCARPDWESAIAAVMAAQGRLDVLMNFAGIAYAKPVHENDPAMIDRILDINLRGVIYGTHFAARQMVAQGHGHIINLGSMASLAPVRGLNLYSATKFGVRGFSLAAAQELKPHGVHLSLICPDAVDTPMLEEEASMPDAAMVFSIRRPLTVQDIERAVLTRVLPGRGGEYILPRTRAPLARLASAWPALLESLGQVFLKAGSRRQAAYRKALDTRR